MKQLAVEMGARLATLDKGEAEIYAAEAGIKMAALANKMAPLLPKGTKPSNSSSRKGAYPSSPPKLKETDGWQQVGKGGKVVKPSTQNPRKSVSTKSSSTKSKSQQTSGGSVNSSKSKRRGKKNVKTPVGKASKPVDPIELAEALKKLEPIQPVSVEQERPIKVPTEGGHKLEFRQGLKSLSVHQVMATFPPSLDDVEDYKSMVSDFRKKALAQPSQAKAWLKGAEECLSEIPMRLWVRTREDEWRAKRDLVTNQPYMIGYMALAEMIPNLELKRQDGDYLQAAAMVAALRPLTRSWKRAKTGGSLTLKSKM